MKSDKSLYTNADRTKVVEEGSPEAAFLLVGAGTEVADSVIQSFNPDADLVKQVRASLRDADKEPEAKAVEEAPDNKAIEGPAEIKAESSPRAGRSR